MKSQTLIRRNWISHTKTSRCTHQLVFVWLSCTEVLRVCEDWKYIWKRLNCLIFFSHKTYIDRAFKKSNACTEFSVTFFVNVQMPMCLSTDLKKKWMTVNMLPPENVLNQYLWKSTKCSRIKLYVEFALATSILWKCDIICSKYCTNTKNCVGKNYH